MQSSMKTRIYLRIWLKIIQWNTLQEEQPKIHAVYPSGSLNIPKVLHTLDLLEKMPILIPLKRLLPKLVSKCYQKSDQHPTGRCAVLITGHDRSLVTKLDAANHFTVDHLEKPENWEVVEKAKVYYSAGFFITVSPDSMLKVAKHASEHVDKRFCVNLSAPFICQFFKDPLNQVLEYADIVFGNESEADAYAENNFEKGSYTDRKDIAKKIAALPYKGIGKSRIVVITQGCDPCILAGNGEVSEIPVIKLAVTRSSILMALVMHSLEDS